MWKGANRNILSDSMSLNFQFHRPSSESYQKIYFHEVDKFKDNQLLKRHSKTVFYIFGWTEKYSSRSTQLVIRSYLHRGDHNVVVLDWSDYNNEAYFEKSAPASQEVRNSISRCFKFIFYLNFDTDWFLCWFDIFEIIWKWS